MRKLGKWLAIVLVWVLVTALLLEIGLRFAAPLLPGRFQVGIQYVLTGERYQTNKVEFMMTDSEHGYVLLPDLESVTQAISPEISIQFSTHTLWGSRFGFRTRPVDYLVEVVVVGDSFSFCFTAYEDCWVRKFEVETGLGTVNLAQPGTASVSHWRMIDTFAKPLAPRLVLWQFFGNDFNEDYGFAVERGEIEPMGDEVDTLEQPLDDSLAGWLRAHSVAFAVLDIALGNDWAYMTDYQRLFVEPYQVKVGDGLLKFGESYEQQVMNMDDPRNRSGLPFTRESLSKAKAAVEEWGGTLAVILIPTREEVYADLTVPIMGQESLERLSGPRKTMLALCDELEVLCFDPLPLLQDYARQGQLLYYTDDLHLNPLGNAVLSPLVWKWLGGHGLLYQ